MGEPAFQAEGWATADSTAVGTAGDEYNYAIIDAHLQSIVAIDKQRRAEIAALRRRFDHTDQAADRKRQAVVDQLRKLCTTPRPSSTVSGQPKPSRRSSTVARATSVAPELMTRPASVHDGPAGHALNGFVPSFVGFEDWM